MADIQTYLDYILSKVYGKDVRQAIVDAINQCYVDAAEGITPEITITAITGGTRVTVTVGSTSNYFDVMNGTATNEQVETYVSEWLTDHPEATTTVEDGSISKAKLTSELQADIDTAKAIPNDIGLETTYTGVESDSIDINLNRRRTEFGITYTGGKCYSKTTGELINAGNGCYWSAFRYKPNTRYLVDNKIHVVFFDNNMNFVSCIDAVTEGNQTITAPSTEGYVGFSEQSDRGLAYTNTYAKWVYTDYFVTGMDHKISAQVDWNSVYNRDYIDESLEDVNLLSTAFHVYPINVADGKIHQIEYGKTYASNPYRSYDANQSVGVVTFYNENKEKIANPTGIGTGGSGTGGWSDRSGNLTIMQGTRFSIVGNVITSYAIYGNPQSGTIELADTPVYIQIVSTTRWTVGVFTDEVSDEKVNCTYNDEDSSGFIEDISDSIANDIVNGVSNMSAIMQATSIMAVNRMRHAFRVASWNIYGAGRSKTNWADIKNRLPKYGIDLIGFQEVSDPLGRGSDTTKFADVVGGWHLSQFSDAVSYDTNARIVAGTSDFVYVGGTDTVYDQQSNYGNRYYARTEFTLPTWKGKYWSDHLKVSVYDTQLEVGTSESYTNTRLAQARQLVQAMQSDPNPFIILVGDFNEMATDQSTFAIFREAGFTQVFDGNQTPTSYRGFYDNIFVNDRITVVNDDVVPITEKGDTISDHNLIMADVIPDYSNIIVIKKTDENCTISGENWLDRRTTEPVTITVTADEGYTVSNITVGQGDSDLTYNNGAITKNGNTITVTPNLVAGDMWISVTTTANA